MLCCEPESEQAASSALLAAAFDAFPDKDYCLLTLPPDSPEVALLGTFTRLLPPPGSALLHVLYLCHRFALLDQLQVGATHPVTALVGRYKLRSSVDQVLQKMCMHAHLGCRTLSQSSLTTTAGRPHSNHRLPIAVCLELTLRLHLGSDDDWPLLP